MKEILSVLMVVFTCAACSSPCEVSGNCTAEVKRKAESCEDEACCFAIEPEIEGETGSCTISVGD